jgi:hypothetical protein
MNITTENFAGSMSKVDNSENVEEKRDGRNMIEQINKQKEMKMEPLNYRCD